ISITVSATIATHARAANGRLPLPRRRRLTRKQAGTQPCFRRMVNADSDQQRQKRHHPLQTFHLRRFERQLTRIEVHLNDENGAKTGVNDKRCTLEARPRGLPPLVVTGVASSTQHAVSAAAEKMKRQLDATFGRLAARRFNAPE